MTIRQRLITIIFKTFRSIDKEEDLQVSDCPLYRTYLFQLMIVIGQHRRYRITICPGFNEDHPRVWTFNWLFTSSIQFFPRVAPEHFNSRWRPSYPWFCWWPFLEFIAWSATAVIRIWWTRTATQSQHCRSGPARTYPIPNWFLWHVAIRGYKVNFRRDPSNLMVL